MRIEREPSRPTAATMTMLEGVATLIRPERTDLTEWFDGYVANHKSRIAFDVEMVQAMVPANARLLEFGCVPLLLTAALKTLGYRVTGVDITPERFQSSIARLGLDVLKCDIEREPVPVETGSVDAVLFNELFEHLRVDLIFTMREVLRVLSPGGTLLLSTPNLGSLVGIVNFLRYGQAFSCGAQPYTEFEKLHTIGHMGHVREYTPQEVTDFLEKVGFKVDALVFRGRNQGALARMMVSAVPVLRPFVTVRARKSAATGMRE